MELSSSRDDCVLEPLQFYHRPFVAHITGVESGLGLEQDNMDFVVGFWHVLDAFRDDDEFAGRDKNVAVAEAHVHAAFHDEKHFVFVVVVMPDECAFKFHDLHVGFFHFADDFRAPVFFDLRELFIEIYDFHFFPLCRRKKLLASGCPHEQHAAEKAAKHEHTARQREQNRCVVQRHERNAQYDQSHENQRTAANRGVFIRGFRDGAHSGAQSPKNQYRSEHVPQSRPRGQPDSMRRCKQNQKRAQKQHDEFIQKAEETRGRLHLEIPTAGIISHAVGRRQTLWREAMRKRKSDQRSRGISADSGLDIETKIFSAGRRRSFFVDIPFYRTIYLITI